MKGGDFEKKDMKTNEYKEIKGYLLDYKKLFFHEHEVAADVLESQHHFELTLSCLDSRMDDVKTNTGVMTGEVEFIKEEMWRMECSLVENFNGKRNYLDNMRVFLAGLVQETKDRLVSQVNQLKLMVEEMQEEMNELMADIHGLIRTLEPTD